MQYINPIEILGLSDVIEIANIDNQIIKKPNVNYLLILIYLIMVFLNIMDFSLQKATVKKQ